MGSRFKEPYAIATSVGEGRTTSCSGSELILCWHFSPGKISLIKPGPSHEVSIVSSVMTSGGFNGNLLGSLVQVIFPRCSCVVLRFLLWNSNQLSSWPIGPRYPFWLSQPIFFPSWHMRNLDFLPTQTNVGKNTMSNSFPFINFSQQSS